jgi:hypothetical protein
LRRSKDPTSGASHGYIYLGQLEPMRELLAARLEQCEERTGAAAIAG